MRVAIECAGFTPGEADLLRKSMATFKSAGGISHFRDKLVAGMVARGYQADFAERIFRQLEGFGSYGFPESHAASFALLAYASAWLKCRHPEVFCAALLNSQPMGFYGPAQIVRDAREHGVGIRPVCVNASDWDCTLEPAGAGFAVRLGLRMIKGLSEPHGRAVAAARKAPFASVEDLWRRAGVPITALTALAEADAFRPALGLARREALWAIRGLRDEELPLFAAAARREGAMVAEVVEPAVALRPMPAGREVVKDYGHTGLTLRRHPVAFLRPELARRRIVTCAEAMGADNRRRVEAAGIILVRQRPGSAKGVMFITLEDETGIANVVVWPKLFERYRRVILSAGMIAVAGRIQSADGVVHLVAQRIADLSPELASVGERGALPEERGGTGKHGWAGGENRQHGAGQTERPLETAPRRPGDSIRVPTRDFR